MERAPRPEANTLIDVTVETVAKLHARVEAETPFRAQPRGLYVLAPGTKAEWNEFVDKGCRGGWSEHHTSTLDTDYRPVEEVYGKGWGKLGITVRLANNHEGIMGVSPEEMNRLRFYETPETPDPVTERVKTTIKSTLAQVPFVRFTDMSSFVGDERTLVARAVDPLGRPVMTTDRRHSTKIEPLDHHVEAFDAYRDEDRTYVQFYPRDADDLERVTGWLPLDDVEFATKALRPRDIINHRLFAAAETLIARYPSPKTPRELAAMNTLLKSQESVYYNPRVVVPYPALTQFVIATVARGGRLRDLRQTDLRKGEFRQPEFKADRILHTPNRPWVVDDTTKTATPLLVPALSHYDPKRGY